MKLYFNYLNCLIILMVSTQKIFSQKNLNTIVNEQISQNHGAAILIANDGKIKYEKYLGFSNREYQIKTNKQTVFPIGSITKQFTAAAILLLQEKGKLNTSDYIEQYLPNFKKSQFPITIKHLLTHTSGIASDNQSKEISKHLFSGISASEIAHILKKTKLKFAPGSSYKYSNNGYILLGLIIEKVSGLSYKDFIHKHIFQPLKMKNSSATFFGEIIRNKASGYNLNENNNQLSSVNSNIAHFSAGCIVSNVRDLNIWTNALFNFKVINKKSLDEMLTNFQLNNGTPINEGYGWEINEINGVKTYEHSGSIPGFKANSIYVPTTNTYTIVMQNSEDDSPTPATIYLTAASIKRPYPSKKSTHIDKGLTKNFTGTFLLDNNSKRYIGKDAEGFYIKSFSGSKRRLFLLDNYTLSYNNSYRTIAFNKDFSGFTYKNRSYVTKAKKISDEIIAEQQETSISEKELKKYVGNYVSEAISIEISLIDKKLYGKPRGSNSLPILSKGNGQFFIKEIGAQLTFKEIKVNSSNKMQLEILLEGNKMVLVRE